MSKCEFCEKEMLTANGCIRPPFLCDDKKYYPIKVGDHGDFLEGEDRTTRCSDCNALMGHPHHLGCDNERCPVCGNQLISCDCNLKDIIDVFFVNKESESVIWMYYNPDSNSGGQYVENICSFEQIKKASKLFRNDTANFFDYLGSVAKQTLYDLNTEYFKIGEKAFNEPSTLENCTINTMKQLINFANKQIQKN